MQERCTGWSAPDTGTWPASEVGKTFWDLTQEQYEPGEVLCLCGVLLLAAQQRSTLWEIPWIRDFTWDQPLWPGEIDAQGFEKSRLVQSQLSISYTQAWVSIKCPESRRLPLVQPKNGLDYLLSVEAWLWEGQLPFISPIMYRKAIFRGI